MSPPLVDGQPMRFAKVAVAETLQLRHSVLWPNMPLAHVCLPEDGVGLHLGALLPHKSGPIAVISLFIQGVPIDKDFSLSRTNDGQDIVLDDTSKRAVQFRKFACDPEFQGKGIGTQLLMYALSMSRSQLDVTTVWCDARTTAQGWYAKRGFVPFGECFHKGPVEYIRMQIDLCN
ncbi:hypothetical protein B0H34DRAFT_679849 [Crassisporium funariophilum]|nr:hypothetical protein B0H34DRAFT_679849 [Crassisporium funariophilum]